MIEFFLAILHHLSQYGIFELILISLGFVAAQFRQFMLPVQLTIFMIKIIQWWMKTHPHGKQMAKETGYDEYFEKVFGKHLHKYGEIASKVDTAEKSDL